jgi:hypothetical protein
MKSLIQSKEVWKRNSAFALLAALALEPTFVLLIDAIQGFTGSVDSSAPWTGQTFWILGFLLLVSWLVTRLE